MAVRSTLYTGLFLVVGVLALSGCGKSEVSVSKLPQDKEKSELMQSSLHESDLKLFTMDAIAKHNTQEDCWVSVDGMVADVTDFFGKHPGGDKNLAKACGTEASKLFQSVKKHDPEGYNKFQEFIIGKILE